MFAYVKGIVADITEDCCVIDVHDVGVNIHISAQTAARMPGIGQEAKLYTYTSVREDAFWLYGFLSKGDLEMFKRCITVSGIGPKGALGLLSVMDGDQLRFAILAQDVKALSKAPGQSEAMKAVSQVEGAETLDSSTLLKQALKKLF